MYQPLFVTQTIVVPLLSKGNLNTVFLQWKGRHKYHEFDLKYACQRKASASHIWQPPETRHVLEVSHSTLQTARSERRETSSKLLQEECFASSQPRWRIEAARPRGCEAARPPLYVKRISQRTSPHYGRLVALHSSLKVSGSINRITTCAKYISASIYSNQK